MEKEEFCFSKNARNHSGLHTECKSCDSLRRKEYRLKTKEARKASRQRYYQQNLDKMRKEKRDYYTQNKDKKRVYDTEYRDRQKAKIALYKKAWELQKRDDPIFKIKRNLRRRVHHVLKGYAKADRTFNLIGCTAEEFKKHLESLWLPGMSWDNYGLTGWHIDHIIPCYTFDLTIEEEQRKCFHYSNQRPLWAKDNLSRGRDFISR